MIQHPYLLALFAILAFAIVSWLASLSRDNVSFVDSLWSLFFLVAAAVYAAHQPEFSTRALIVAVLLVLWALRLSMHITIRNWGEPEDHRYQSIRANNEPGFRFKSLYIVFGLQGVLAWLVALPLLPALASPLPLGNLDYLAIVLWLVGFVFEAVGDYQLRAFKSRQENRGRVLDTGLWRYSRHPNYFGEFCIWWAFFLFAAAAGSWWTIVSPLLMSTLLLRVSGVAMLERTIGGRRPEYRDYILRTNTFFPGPPRRSGARTEVIQ